MKYYEESDVLMLIANLKRISDETDENSCFDSSRDESMFYITVATETLKTFTKIKSVEVVEKETYDLAIEVLKDFADRHPDKAYDIPGTALAVLKDLGEVE